MYRITTECIVISQNNSYGSSQQRSNGKAD